MRCSGTFDRFGTWVAGLTRRQPALDSSRRKKYDKAEGTLSRSKGKENPTLVVNGNGAAPTKAVEIAGNGGTHLPVPQPSGSLTNGSP